MQRKALVRLRAITRFHASSPVSARGPPSHIPTVWTSAHGVPISLSTASKARPYGALVGRVAGEASGLRQRLGRVEVERRDASAGGSEVLDDDSSEPPARSGDDDDAVGEFRSHQGRRRR